VKVISNRGKLSFNIFLIFSFLILNFSFLCAETFDFREITNEISLYQNRYDDFLNAGQTFQVVSINSIRAWTWFNLEITWDMNYDLEKEDDFTHYVEFGLVKPVKSGLSINYQRIHGTFVPDPINQVGIRYSF